MSLAALNQSTFGAMGTKSQAAMDPEIMEEKILAIDESF
jgi:hypothetical protein